MKILSFHIENFRNLRLAECSNLPDFIVICGGNGCGKSALLEALITAKELVGSYSGFRIDPNAISADATKAIIKMKLEFSEEEQLFVKSRTGNEYPRIEEIFIEINKPGSARRLEARAGLVSQLLSYYSRKSGSIGFFDYIRDDRRIQKTQLKRWEADFLSDDRTKRTFASEDKFQLTKHYLASLKMQDLQELQTSQLAGEIKLKDSLENIRKFFNSFFAPKKFKDVLINKVPFKFIISTPSGNIDIDDLSAGEKEILNIYIRFHQLNPKGAVILFDEADAHLHPELERRYLELLRKLGEVIKS